MYEGCHVEMLAVFFFFFVFSVADCFAELCELFAFLVNILFLFFSFLLFFFSFHLFIFLIFWLRSNIKLYVRELLQNWPGGIRGW